MGKRTYISDITAMALLYRKEYCGTTMISYEKVEEFDRVINNNLDEMNSSCGIGIRCSGDEETSLYFMATDEEGKLYAVINPGANFKKAWDFHIGTLPIDVIKASYRDNAMNVIGLQYNNGKLCQIEKNKPITRILTK